MVADQSEYPQWEVHFGYGNSRLIAPHEMGMTALGDTAWKIYWKYVLCRFQWEKKEKQNAIRHCNVHVVRVTCPCCWLCFILTNMWIRNWELPCMCRRKASLTGLHTHDRGNPLRNPNAVYLASSAAAPCPSRGFEKQCDQSKQKLNQSCNSIWDMVTCNVH